MNLRWASVLTGTAMAIVGLLFLVTVPITLADSAGVKLHCGTPVQRDGGAATAYAMKREEEQTSAALDARRDLPNRPVGGSSGGRYIALAKPDCDDAFGIRRRWAMPLAASGTLVLLSVLMLSARESVARRPQ